jgi:hypothetical protein
MYMKNRKDGLDRDCTFQGSVSIEEAASQPKGYTAVSS